MAKSKQVKPKPREAGGINLSNITVFNGIKWEGLGIETLSITAKALLTITELFKAQNVSVEAGIKITSPEFTPNGRAAK